MPQGPKRSWSAGAFIPLAALLVGSLPLALCAKHVVIVAEGRSGSSFLLDLLTSEASADPDGDASNSAPAFGYFEPVGMAKKGWEAWP